MVDEIIKKKIKEELDKVNEEKEVKVKKERLSTMLNASERALVLFKKELEEIEFQYEIKMKYPKFMNPQHEFETKPEWEEFWKKKLTENYKMTKDGKIENIESHNYRILKIKEMLERL